MVRYTRFTFLCDTNERRAIADLAKKLQRSQSDAVRFVVIEATRQLTQTNISLAKELPNATKELKEELEVENKPIYNSQV